MKKCQLMFFCRSIYQVVQPPETHGGQESRAEDYLKKSVVLKQIMSNKARGLRIVNGIQNFLTVAVSALLLFFGFSGLDKIQMYVSWVHPIGREGVELGFNFLVFLLFVVGVLHLVFRFHEKQNSAEKGVADLASLANEIEDSITSKGSLILIDSSAKIELIRRRYEAIAEHLPANTDKEFLQAKRDVATKSSRKPTIHIIPQQLFDRKQQERIVTAIVLGSRAIVDILLALRSVDDSLYLGGGMIRNAVWDYLHGYKSPTPVDDVDVILFNTADSEKRHDTAVRDKLLAKIPNANWSVKNQARMHTINGEQPYASIEDAISRWPETTTAFIARLDESGKLVFINPYGFDDLLRLLITNTAPFADRTDVIRRRAKDKRWMTLWPRLKLILPEQTEKTDFDKQ